jgi:hypothetical protein
MIAWVKVRVKGPVNVLGSKLSECEVLNIDGSIADPGFIYIHDDALIVDSVARTARENAQKPAPRPQQKQERYVDDW